jgi:hypothetical protein
LPSGLLSSSPSDEPSASPSLDPTIEPSSRPTGSQAPSGQPTLSEGPSQTPSVSKEPSNEPTISSQPSTMPSLSVSPSVGPTVSLSPTMAPTNAPSMAPSYAPTMVPTTTPSAHPTATPTKTPTAAPTVPITPAPIPPPPAIPRPPPETIIEIVVTITFACPEVGWKITDSNGTVVDSVSLGEYPSFEGHAVHHLELVSGETYIFTLLIDYDNENEKSKMGSSFTILQDTTTLASGVPPFESETSIVFRPLPPSEDGSVTLSGNAVSNGKTGILDTGSSESPVKDVCTTVGDCIGVRAGLGCPLCKRSHPDDKFGICQEGCSGFLETNLAARACCKLNENGLEFTCTSHCENGICLQNPGLNWLNNHALRCGADDTSVVCSEEYPNGGTVEVAGAIDAVTYQPLSVCQAAVAEKAR